MVTIRLTRVQNELNKLEDKKHFKFVKGDIAEKDCRDEMEKLCNLIANILGKKSFGNGANSNITACSDVGKDARKNNANNDPNAKDTMKNSRSDSFYRNQDVVLELPNQIVTEFDEFNWNRERKLKPRHIV